MVLPNGAGRCSLMAGYFQAGDGVTGRIRRVLVGICAVFAIAIIGVRALFLYLEYNAHVQQAEERTRYLALVLEENAKKQFGMAKLVSDRVVDYVKRAGGLDSLAGTLAAHRVLAELSDQLPASAALNVFDERGRMAISSNRFPAPADVDVTDREWFMAVNAGGHDSFIGGLIRGRVTEELVFPYARRLTDAKGRFVGGLIVSLRPERLQAVYSNSFSDHVVLGMFRSDGRMLSRSPAAPESTETAAAKTAVFTTLNGSPAGTLRAVSPFDGDEKIISFRRLESLPVVVIAGVSVEHVLASFRRDVWLSTAVVGIALIGLFWITAIGLRLARDEEKGRKALQASKDQLSAAIKEKDMLFREIYHRTKNNLMMVISLLELQSMRFDDAKVRAAFTETEERLQAMSLVYEALYRRDNATRVEIKDYLEALVSTLAKAYGAETRGVALELDMHEASVSVDKAVPLALAVNEAVTNAFKHAFRDRGGVLHVSSSESGGICSVVVADDGVGLPEGSAERKRSSLGMTIIRSMANQLAAQVRLEANPSGKGVALRLDFAV